MKIPEITTLQMNRTSDIHFTNTNTASLKNQIGNTNGTTETKSFQSYLMDAMNAMNDQQVQVSNLQEKIITNPDDVDIHDVTIAMSKARMSLNLAQTVIDRLVSGWNEITTTR